MATWEKIKFYYQTMLGSTGSTLSATSTLSGTAVANIYNMLEGDRWEATDTTSPQYLTYDAGGEIIINGDFETGSTSPWSFIVQGTAAATFTASTSTPYSGTYKGLVAITAIGSITDIQLFQGPISIVKDRIYKASIVAKAAAARTINVNLFKNASPWTAYSSEGVQTLSLTTAWKVFELTFTANITASDARLRFDLGDDINDVSFDNIEFFLPTATADYIASIGHNFFSAGAELSLEASNDNFATTVVMDAYIPSADTVELRELPYLPNPDFEVWSGALPDGWSSFGNGTYTKETTIVKSGSQSIKLVASATNTNSLYQLIHLKTGISFWQGKTISLGVWVYSSTAASAFISIADGVGETLSSFHSGSSAWEFLTVTRTIDVNATFVKLHTVRCSNSDTTYADGAILKIASSVLSTDTNEPFDAANQTPFRYWRRKIGGTLTAAPKAAISIWGNKTELDLARASYDPHGETVKANINIGSTGYLLGIHRRWSERNMSLSFPDMDAAFYAKITTWWETSGLNNFFVAWEHANNPDDVWLMHPDLKFNNPISVVINDSAYRDVTVKLKGRKE